MKNIYKRGFPAKIVSPKTEGERISFDDGQITGKPPTRSKTRWIELCYDPADPIHWATLNALNAIVDAADLDEDAVYNLVKAFANRNVKEDGF